MPEEERAPEGAQAPSAPEQDDHPGSPVRSLFAVLTGWIVLWIAGALYASVVYRLASTHFPDDAPPTTIGLALTLAGALPNGILGGLITGRMAGFAPIAHAAVLAGVIGFFGLMSSDAATGMPAWFAIGRAVAPALSIVLGGAIARWLDGRGARARNARAKSDATAP